jgi:hypothetical protein
MDIIAIQNIEAGLTKPKIIPQLTTRPIIILVRLLRVRIKRAPLSPRLPIQILNDLKIILRSGTRISIPFFLILVLFFLFLLLLFIFVSGLFFLRLIPIVICPNTSSSPGTSTSASSRAISILPIALHPLSGIINHLHIPISIPSSNTRNISLGISYNAILGLLKLALPGFDIGIRF